ncbi:MAG: transcriptional regulator PpsR, partial [Betaproteobacteria bacterium]|nr:transcriptional regulator PpsR [Betaproteobacteria bacterium]
MKRLESPSADLGDLKAEAVAGLLEWSADVVLVLDGQARVIDAAGQAETVDPGELRRWKGKLWADLVTQESRGKLLALLDAA